MIVVVVIPGLKLAGWSGRVSMAKKVSLSSSNSLLIKSMLMVKF